MGGSGPSVNLCGVLRCPAMACLMASNLETVMGVRGEWGNSHRAGDRDRTDRPTESTQGPQETGCHGVLAGAEESGRGAVGGCKHRLSRIR